MAVRKKRRLKKGAIVFFISVIIILLLVFILLNRNNNDSTKNNNNNNVNKDIEEEIKIDYNQFITEESEKNPYIVKEYFVDGMDSNDFINTLSKKQNYISKKGEYKFIEYNFEKQYHYSELEEIYNKLLLSDIVKIEIIGTSVDGRNLYSIEIGSGDEVTMFEAGIHSAEVASPLFITKFMVDLVNDYENGDKDVIELLKTNKIVVLPCANPDGYEAAIFGTSSLNNQNLYLAKNATNESLKYLKCNANGVDINRNFPSQTSGLYYNYYDLHYTVTLNKSTDLYLYYHGETLASEPETKAIMYWQTKWIKNLKSYIALHSAGRIIYNGKPYLSDEYNQISNECATIVENITGYTARSKYDEEAGMGNDGTSSEYLAELLSGFKFSTKTGRLSSEYYAQKYDNMDYKNTCVIVVESLDRYTTNLEIIKNEYFNYALNKAYLEIIKRIK